MGLPLGQLAMNTNGVIPAGGPYVVVGEPVPVPDPAKADTEAEKKIADDMKPFEAAEKKCAELQAKHRDDLEKLLERKKESFAKMVTELNEKRLALTEAEKQARPVELPAESRHVGRRSGIDPSDYRLQLVFHRKSIAGGSAWESNPPGACLQTPHRF